MAIKVAGNVVINDSQAISNITTIDANGNISGNYFIGNGSQLTGIDATAIQNGTANVRTFLNGNVTVSAAGAANVLNVTSTGANIVGTINVSSTGLFGGNIDMSGFTVSNLAVPNNQSDAATKQYVDDVAQGLNIHDSCGAATPDTLANITGGTITYNNGTSGVNANLVTSGSFNLIDGVNVQTAGTRILVKSEANAVHNGIYTWANSTTIVRATDYNSVPEVEAGDFTFVTAGTIYDNTGWVQTDSPQAIGTAGNTISFTQFSGAGTYNAGTGLTLTGTVFSVNASQTQVTEVGTLGNLSVTSNITAGNANVSGQLISTVSTGTAPLVVTSTTVVANLNANALQGNTPSQSATANTIVQRNADGNITANFFIGNGAQLTGLSTAGVSNGNSNVNIPAANGNVNISAAGNANVLVVTGTGIVTGTGSGGNISGANVITANTFLAVSNVTAPQLISNVTTGTAPIVVTSTTVVANLNANALQGNTPSQSATANTIVQRNASGNITANFFVGNGSALTGLSSAGIANGNSNVNIPTSAGNILMSVNGTANVVTVSNTNVVFGSGSGGNLVGANVITANTFTGAFANGNSNVNIPTASSYVLFSAEGNANVLTITGTSAVFGNGSGGNISGANVITANSANILVSLGVGTAPSGTTGEIRATNNITAYYSDKRLKTNIVTIEGALEKLCAISGVYFRPNEVAQGFGYDNKLQVGVIAQEIEAVLPEIVTRAPFDIIKDKEGNEISKSGENYKTVWYDKLIPLVIEAVKELKVEVDVLKNKIK